jgi:hypothetical protein
MRAVPALLERLRCGVIFTGAFIDHLREECARERLRAASTRGGKGDSNSRIPVIHYVRCLDGERKDEAWWSVNWERRDKLAAGDLFTVAGVEVALPRQTQKGLKWRHIDFRDGKVVVG